jgi:transposase InsO family protein
VLTISTVVELYRASRWISSLPKQHRLHRCHSQLCTVVRRWYNGSLYVSGYLAEWLQDKGMKHSRGAPYHLSPDRRCLHCRDGPGTNAKTTCVLLLQKIRHLIENLGDICVLYFFC